MLKKIYNKLRYYLYSLFYDRNLDRFAENVGIKRKRFESDKKLRCRIKDSMWII